MISIIVPVLNEAQTIENLIDHLKANTSNPQNVEIIIVDGGSTDRTLAIVHKYINASQATEKQKINLSCINSQKGRAKQMNTGAKNAKGEILYFLHADSFPPKNYDSLILDQVAKGNPAGCFKMKFNSSHWWLRLVSYFTKFSWRMSRGGDQSQFITKELFNQIGGYDEDYIIYEDNILINELYKRDKFVVIQESLVTSARLYEEKGVWRVQYHFLIIYFKKWLGADANELYSYYCKHLKTTSSDKFNVTQPQTEIITPK